MKGHYVSRYRSLIITFLTLGGLVLAPRVGDCRTSDFMVYSVYHELSLGNPQEVPQKDYFINMGSQQGLHIGSILEVMRKVSTYDLIHESLYRDVVFPIGFVKVIHVESNASIARLEKLLPVDIAPISNPRSIIVGDLVRIKVE